MGVKEGGEVDFNIYLKLATTTSVCCTGFADRCDSTKKIKTNEIVFF